MDNSKNGSWTSPSKKVSRLKIKLNIFVVYDNSENNTRVESEKGLSVYE